MAKRCEHFDSYDIERAEIENNFIFNTHDALKEITQDLKSVETAIQLLTGQIIALRTELLVIKAIINTQDTKKE